MTAVEMIKVLLVCGAVVLMVSPAAEAGQKQLTCKTLTAVDGDTVQCDGQLLRDMGEGSPGVSGYDTPEIRSYKCPAEKALGMQAKKRMAELIKTKGLTIIDSGKTVSGRGGKTRLLVWIKMPDGSTVGGKLIAEGLAARWTP